MLYVNTDCCVFAFKDSKIQFELDDAGNMEGYLHDKDEQVYKNKWRTILRDKSLRCYQSRKIEILESKRRVEHHTRSRATLISVP